MTNNFKLLREYLQSEGLLEGNYKGLNDLYYTVELIRRGKDHPDCPAANYRFKNYYIDSLSRLDRYEEEIIKLCDVLKLRAYISVNRKSYTKVLKDTVVESARRVASGDFKRPYNIWESCSGKCVLHKNVRFIVDIDEELVNNTDYYINVINTLCDPLNVNNKILLTVPTKSGCHLVTSGFNIKVFKETLAEQGISIPEIKKNHLTLLYENLNGGSSTC